MEGWSGECVVERGRARDRHKVWKKAVVYREYVIAEKG